MSAYVRVLSMAIFALSLRCNSSLGASIACTFEGSHSDGKRITRNYTTDFDRGRRGHLVGRYMAPRRFLAVRSNGFV